MAGLASGEIGDQPVGNQGALAPQTLQANNLPHFGGAAAAMPQANPQAAAQQRQLAEKLKEFWEEQMGEVEQVGTDPAEFKNHQLPLARIKKIMKSDEDVRMISAEAPVLFARACEMFILELTLRSWSHSEENKRRTLQRNDIAAAITRTDIFDFLVDIVPREERADEVARAPLPAPAATAAAAAPGILPQPYYGMPGQLAGQVPAMPQSMPQSMPMDPAVYQQYLSQWNPAAVPGMPPMPAASIPDPHLGNAGGAVPQPAAQGQSQPGQTVPQPAAPPGGLSAPAQILPQAQAVPMPMPVTAPQQQSAPPPASL